MNRKYIVGIIIVILIMSLVSMIGCIDKKPTDDNLHNYDDIILEDPDIPHDNNNDEEPVEIIIEQDKAVLALGDLNIRSTPTINESNVVGILRKNNTVRLISQYSDNWNLIEYNGIQAYVSASSKYTKIIDKDYQLQDKSVLALADLNIRSTPSTSGAIIGSLKTNHTIKLIRKHDDNWYLIDYNGREAYVTASAKYSRIVHSDYNYVEQLIENIIAIGMSQLGVPYEYGAQRLLHYNGSFNTRFTGNTFDCSSFVQYAFYMGGGIKLKDTSRSQSLEGTLIPLNQLQRGDIIFMTSTARQYNTGIERIGHVVIYLGDNRILHTFGTGGVRIQTYTDFWRGRAILARRMV